jgi:hypothetical protein
MSTIIASQDYSFYLQVKEVINYVIYFVTVIILPIGFFLNIISMLIFNRKNFSGETIKFYYNFILANNNIVIVINFITYLSQSLNNDIALLSNFTCVLSHSSRVFTIFASWLQVLVTVDRFIHIYYPHKCELIKRTKILLIIIFFIFTSCILICTVNFYYSIVEYTSIYSTTNKTITTRVCTAPKNIVFVRDIITVVARGLIPIILIGVFNSCLIYKLKNSKAYFFNNEILKKEYYFACSIAWFNIFFLATLVFYTLSLLLLNIVQNLAGVSMISRVYVISNIIMKLALITTIYNFCFSFFINLKFNILFRNEILILFYNLKNNL